MDIPPKNVGECFENCPIVRAARAALVARLDDPDLPDEQKALISGMYSPTEAMLADLSKTCSGNGDDDGECGSIVALNAAHSLYANEFDPEFSKQFLIGVHAVDPENGQYSIYVDPELVGKDKLVKGIIKAIGNIAGIDQDSEPEEVATNINQRRQRTINASFGTFSRLVRSVLVKLGRKSD